MTRSRTLAAGIFWGMLSFACFDQADAESQQCNQARASSRYLDQEITQESHATADLFKEISARKGFLRWDAMWLVQCLAVVQEFTRYGPSSVSQCEKIIAAHHAQRERIQAMEAAYNLRAKKLDDLLARQQALVPTINECDMIGEVAGERPKRVQGCDDLTAEAASGNWKWFGGENTVVTLSGDGSATSRYHGRQQNEGYWGCEEGQIVIHWQRLGNKWTDYLVLTDGGRKLNGINQFASPVWGTRD